MTSITRRQPAPHIEYLKAKIEKARGVLYVHTTFNEGDWCAEAEGDNPMYPDCSGSQFRTIGVAYGGSEIAALDKLAARLGVAGDAEPLREVA